MALAQVQSDPDEEALARLLSENPVGKGISSPVAASEESDPALERLLSQPPANAAPAAPASPSFRDNLYNIAKRGTAAATSAMFTPIEKIGGWEAAGARALGLPGVAENLQSRVQNLQGKLANVRQNEQQAASEMANAGPIARGIGAAAQGAGGILGSLPYFGPMGGEAAAGSDLIKSMPMVSQWIRGTAAIAPRLAGVGALEAPGGQELQGAAQSAAFAPIMGGMGAIAPGMHPIMRVLRGTGYAGIGTAQGIGEGKPLPEAIGSGIGQAAMEFLPQRQGPEPIPDQGPWLDRMEAAGAQARQLPTMMRPAPAEAKIAPRPSPIPFREAAPEPEPMPEPPPPRNPLDVLPEQAQERPSAAGKPMTEAELEALIRMQPVPLAPESQNVADPREPTREQLEADLFGKRPKKKAVVEEVNPNAQDLRGYQNPVPAERSAGEESGANSSRDVQWQNPQEGAVAGGQQGSAEVGQGAVESPVSAVEPLNPTSPADQGEASAIPSPPDASPAPSDNFWKDEQGSLHLGNILDLFTGTPDPNAQPRESKTAGEHWNEAKDALARYGGASFPALKRASKGKPVDASLAASKLAAVPEMTHFLNQAWQADLRGIAEAAGKPHDELMNLAGAAAAEDQLQGIRERALQDYQDTGDPKFLKKASSVKSIIGQKDSPLQTDADYQKALADPAVAKVIDYYKQNIEPVITDFYKASSKFTARDAEGNPVEPPKRGSDFGMHLSLKAERPDESLPSGKLPSGGNIRNTLEKHSMLEREATGAGEKYSTHFGDLVENALRKSIMPGVHAQFYKALIDNGLAVESAPGEHPTIGGKRTVSVPLKYWGSPDNRVLNIRADLMEGANPEVRNALNIDRQEGALGGLGDVLTKIQLASGVEGISHTVNMFSQLLIKPTSGGHLPDAVANIPGVKLAGILDTVGTNLAKILTKDPATMHKLAELASQGALKPSHEGGKPGILNIPAQLGRALDVLSNASRLAISDGYDKMVKMGIVPDDPAVRRDWINQIGQYHKEAQSRIVRMARSSGAGPFATAGSTFQSAAARMNRGFAPGIETTGAAGNMKLRAYAAMQIAGFLALAPISNYLLTGQIQPKGVPPGGVYLGKDKDGKVRYEDIAEVSGVKRALRQTGAQALIEGPRQGDAINPHGLRDRMLAQIESSLVSPFMGPVPTAGIEAGTGYNPHGLYKTTRGAEENDRAAWVREALQNLNPSASAFWDDRTGGLAGQLGKLAPKTQHETPLPKPPVVRRIEEMQKPKNPLPVKYRTPPDRWSQLFYQQPE